MKWWIFLIPVGVIFLLGSLVYGCSELTIHSWPASIGACQRHWIVWQLLYDYQGLVGGLLALIAAGIGAWALRQQSAESLKQQRLAALFHYRAAINITAGDYLSDHKIPEIHFSALEKATYGLRVIDKETVWLGMVLFRQAVQGKDLRLPVNKKIIGLSAFAMQMIIQDLIDRVEENRNTPLAKGSIVPKPIVFEQLKKFSIKPEQLVEVGEYYKWD